MIQLVILERLINYAKHSCKFIIKLASARALMESR